MLGNILPQQWASKKSNTLSSLRPALALGLAHMYTGYGAGLSLNLAICDQYWLQKRHAVPGLSSTVVALTYELFWCRSHAFRKLKGLHQSAQNALQSHLLLTSAIKKAQVLML